MVKIDQQYNPDRCDNCNDGCETCKDAFKHVGSLSEVKGTPFFDQNNYHIVRYKRK